MTPRNELITKYLPLYEQASKQNRIVIYLQLSLYEFEMKGLARCQCYTHLWVAKENKESQLSGRVDILYDMKIVMSSFYN